MRFTERYGVDEFFELERPHPAADIVGIKLVVGEYIDVTYENDDEAVTVEDEGESGDEDTDNPDEDEAEIDEE